MYGIDNGKDYDAWIFHGQTKSQRRAKVKPAIQEAATFSIFDSLQIEAHLALPYNPNGKSRMERFFRSLESLCKTFDTYAGDSADSKPEQRSATPANPAKIPRFDFVRDRVAGFIDGYNLSNEHNMSDLVDGGVNLSPDEAMARWCQTRRVLADPASLDHLLQQWHRPVTVGRIGISLCIAGATVGYGQFNPALTPFKAARKEDRKPVVVSYDPHDLRRVQVRDAQLRFICIADMNQLGGMHGRDAISRAHVAELQKQKATYQRSIEHVAEHSFSNVLTNEERLASIAAKRATPPTPVAPAASIGPSMKMVHTPIDGQSKSIERAEFRIAVGAESQSAGIPNAFDVLGTSNSRNRRFDRDDVPNAFDEIARDRR